MSDSVLNLGEKIVLAARLAAIEHVRQVIAEQDSRLKRLEATDGLDAEDLQDFVRMKWRGFYAPLRATGERGAA